jgi:hypothetical protein
MREWRGKNPCSPSCYDLSIEERLHARLLPVDPVTGCIEWVGSRTGDGYGNMRIEGRIILAHRLAYELKHGPIPDGMCVLHGCDNPPCCNVDHLFLGTNKDNVDDKLSKGRSGFKLTESDIRSIKKRLNKREPQESIAKDFGVSKSNVSLISRGKAWAHIK